MIALIGALAAFHLPLFPSVQLDGSWALGLAHAQAHGAVWGRDVIFTYGPLAILAVEAWTPWHWWAHWAWQAFRAAVFAWVLVEFAFRMHPARRALWVGCVTLVVASVNGAFLPAQATMLGAWLIMARRNAAGSAQRAGVLAAGFWLGIAATMKFSLLLLAAFGVGLAGFAWFAAGRLFGAVGVVATPLAGFALAWMGAGQPLAAVPAYVRAGLELSGRYAEEMGLEGSWTMLVLGVVSLAALAAWLAQMSWSRGGMARFPSTLFLAGSAFLGWKQGFVRADDTTGLHFLQILLIAAGGAALLGEPSPQRTWRRWTSALLPTAGLAAATGYIGNPYVRPALSLDWFRLQGGLLARAWALGPASGQTLWRREWEKAAAKAPLAETRARVGDERIDVLGFSQSAVVLGGLHYAPHPVIQSYAALTPALLERNAAFYQDPARAPRWVLQRLESVDGRLPAVDDSTIFAALARDYEFDGAEDGFLRWRRREAGGAAEILRPTGPTAQVRAMPGEMVTIPALAANETRWLRVRWNLSSAGRARAALYKLPPVWLELEHANGETVRWRLPLAMAARAFLIDPPLTQPEGWTALLTGQPAKAPVLRVGLNVAPGHRHWFERRAEFVFETAPAVAPGWHEVLPEGGPALLSQFPRGIRRVDSPHPVAAIQLGDRVAVQIHAPSLLELEVPPDPAGRALLATGYCGLPDGAWNDAPGATDGAEFSVAWRDATGVEVLLWTRLLDPRAKSEDRGAVGFQVRAGAEITRQGGRLIFRTNPGPAGDQRWDWTAWAGVRWTREAE